MAWWQRAGLLGDPFDRISGIEEVGIDNLIVETPILKRYSDRLFNDTQSLLGKSIIIFGEFGSGRTTLFLYLKGLFHREGIQSYIIRLHGSFGDSSDIEKQFLTFLYFKLTGQIKDDASLLDIIKELRDKKHKTPKYFIFIDELHKNQMIDSSLEFLKNLQGIIEELNEEVSFGVMIAGRNEWKKSVTNEPIYSGTFGTYDEIDDMTPDDACQMIDKRVKRYYPNIDEYKEFSLIEDDAIVKVYSRLDVKTSRSLIRAMSRCVEDAGSSAVTITSSEIHNIGADVISKVNAYITSIPIVYNRLSKVKNERRKDAEWTAPN